MKKYVLLSGVNNVGSIGIEKEESLRCAHFMLTSDDNFVTAEAVSLQGRYPDITHVEVDESSKSELLSILEDNIESGHLSLEDLVSDSNSIQYGVLVVYYENSTDEPVVASSIRVTSHTGDKLVGILSDARSAVMSFLLDIFRHIDNEKDGE